MPPSLVYYTNISSGWVYIGRASSNILTNSTDLTDSNQTACATTALGCLHAGGCGAGGVLGPRSSAAGTIRDRWGMQGLVQDAAWSAGWVLSTATLSRLPGTLPRHSAHPTLHTTVMTPAQRPPMNSHPRTHPRLQCRCWSDRSCWPCWLPRWSTWLCPSCFPARSWGTWRLSARLSIQAAR
jgi:hypothetical protein